jgi:hypothetical protein
MLTILSWYCYLLYTVVVARVALALCSSLLMRREYILIYVCSVGHSTVSDV